MSIYMLTISAYLYAYDKNGLVITIYLNKNKNCHRPDKRLPKERVRAVIFKMSSPAQIRTF